MYYVDTSRTAVDGKKKRKLHTVFDGERVFKVRRLTGLGDAGEVFIDSLFPEIYGEVLELLRKSVRVYVLKNTVILKKLRLENNVEKSDENDALVLSKISKEMFREVTVQEIKIKIEIEPLVNEYIGLSKDVKEWKQKLKNKQYSENVRESIRDTIKVMEKEKKNLGRQIIEIIRKNELYGKVYENALNLLNNEGVKVKDSVTLAILTIKLPLHLNKYKLKTYCGCTEYSKKTGQYNHTIHYLLSSLATNIDTLNQRRRGIIVDEERKKRLNKIMTMILKALRKTWLETIELKNYTQSPLADER